MARTRFKLSICLLLFLSFAAPAPAHAAQSAHAPARYAVGEVIVKLKSHGQVGKMAVSQKSAAFLARAQDQKGYTLKSSFRELNLYHFRIPAGQKVEDAIADLQTEPEVAYVEPNYILTKASVNLPSQHYSMQEVQAMAASQPQAQSTGSGSNSASSDNYQATSAAIEVTNTWGNVTQNSTAIVAVVDTGLDTTHPVFTGTNAIWTNTGEIPANQIDDDNNGFIDDVNGYNFVSNSGAMLDDDGHGTHVSGIIVGVGQSIYNGPSSYAPSMIKIMPLKFLDNTGNGTTSDAIKAIYYAVNNGATVINNSWGGPSYSASLQEAVTYAYNAGVVFVAAAGNYSDNNDTTSMYPANFAVPNVISVAATMDNDTMAYFSNFGQGSVPLAAPGVYILSTVPGGGFETMSGTSMATPFVSGLAALMKVQSPTLLSYQIKQLIDAGVDLPKDANGDLLLAGKVETQGRINFLTTMTATKTAVVQTTQPAYTFTDQDRQLASTLAASGCGLVKKFTGGDSDGPAGPFGGPQSWSIYLVLALFALPVLVYQYLRKLPVQRRAHERFKIDTGVTVKVGDRELVGSVSSISMGGVQINTDELIEQGGIISMQIRSPDGKEQMSVEGRIVWSEQKKSYGVRFAETSERMREQISAWTANLQKAPAPTRK